MNKLNGRITKSATMRGALTRGAGGGTYVEANPEGSATETLKKLMVESDIFEIRNVPDASSAPNGDVLTIVNGSPTWDYPVKYSTNEHVVGVWVDGKKLYQKSIKFSATSLSKNWKTIEQGVDYDVAFPEAQGLYYTANGEPFTQSTRVFVQNGELKIQPLNELDLLSSTLKHVITIRYTKVGD